MTRPRKREREREVRSADLETEGYHPGDFCSPAFGSIGSISFSFGRVYDMGFIAKIWAWGKKIYALEPEVQKDALDLLDLLAAVPKESLPEVVADIKTVLAD